MRIVGALIGASLLAMAATAQKWEPYSAGLQSRAAAGDASAQFAMGEAFRTGNGITADREQAIAWYRKAADRDTRAADALGPLLFIKGERKQAMPLLQAAAARRNDYALYILGTARFNGDYVPKDVARAYADLRLASETLPQAQRSLTLMEPYITPIERQRADQLIAQSGGPESGAPTAPSYATTPAYTATVAATPQATRVPLPRASAPVPQRSDSYAAPGSVPLPPPPNVDGPPVPSIRTVELPPSQATTTPAPVKVATAAPVKPTPMKAAPVVKPAAITSTPVEHKTATTKPAPAKAETVTASGGWRVQLGAYGSEDRAATQWKALVAKVPQLGKLTKATQPVGSLVRLQATGLATKDEASATCAAVTASGGACLILAPAQ